MTLRDCISIMKKANSERKKRSVTCKRITRPDVLRMVLQESGPVLSSPSWRTSMPHVLLNGALETQMPSLSNSPRIRSAPQSRFCPAISMIKATVSAGIFGLEDAALDLYFQNRRNPWRCHRRSVSGWTMKSACFHARDARARRIKIRRSFFAFVGRLTCRRRMMSCCRRRAFSATSSDLLLARSVTEPT